jgi:SPP1 gp7 family putative phage head morphogenesis protein
VKSLEELLVDVIPHVDSAGRTVNIPARMENIARTNLSDAFNQARMSVFMSPELGDFVKAFEYTAVLDPSTTDFCRYTDGRVYMKDDPIWNSITPPNHYQCRSTLIAITELDSDWTESDPLPESVKPQKGFS